MFTNSINVTTTWRDRNTMYRTIRDVLQLHIAIGGTGEKQASKSKKSKLSISLDQ